jgi:putative endonuclease
VRNRQKGNRGEAIAARALTEAGYRILDRNWRCAIGELDLIAQQGDELVFVEVRTRTGGSLEGIGAALESITPRKSARLVELAQAYLDTNHLEKASFRIDVVAVSFDSNAPSGAPTVEIIENAVGW